MDTRKQVEQFLAKYSPAIARQTQAVREHLAAQFPRGYELVYDNYNAVACGFSPTPGASGALVSVAAYPKWVTLFFLHGAGLPDPQRILEGSGSRVRSVRLSPPERLHEPAVQELLRHVGDLHAAAFAAAPPLATVVKSVSAKQRPRRPADDGAGAKVRRTRKPAD